MIVLMHPSNKCECNTLQYHEHNIPQANDMFTPKPAKHYKHIHWAWGQHIHSCSFPSLLKPDNSSLTEVIDHCTIDFHWVRHRILRQIGFVSEFIRTILPNVLTAFIIHESCLKPTPNVLRLVQAQTE